MYCGFFFTKNIDCDLLSIEGLCCMSASCCSSCLSLSFWSKQLLLVVDLEPPSGSLLTKRQEKILLFT